MTEMNFSKGHFEVLAASWSSEGQQEKKARREAERERDSGAQKRDKETARVAARRKTVEAKKQEEKQSIESRALRRESKSRKEMESANQILRLR